MSPPRLTREILTTKYKISKITSRTRTHFDLPCTYSCQAREVRIFYLPRKYHHASPRYRQVPSTYPGPIDNGGQGCEPEDSKVLHTTVEHDGGLQRKKQHSFDG